MKNRSTKRALILSVLSLVMCFSMLVGTTYAWFTDSVTSTGNIIRSGTLDVDLVDADGKSLAGKVLEFQKAAGAPADEEVLWEPGCTYSLQDVFVMNKGNLALKYKIIITGIEGNAKLLEVIDWTVTDGTTEYDLNKWYSLAPGATSAAISITGHMREDAGNEYQNLVADGISITIYAIQDTVEYDSFDNQYDAQAQVPEASVSYFDPAKVYPMFHLDEMNAILDYVNNGTVDENALADFKLDAAYKFSAIEDESPYASYIADFVIYADRDIGPESVAIAGQYDGWNVSFPWIALTSDQTIAANTQIRLLQSYGDASITVTYKNVMEEIKDFYCGIANLATDGSNDGTTVTVELRLYERDGSVETGEYITVGTVEYTFGKTAIVSDAESLKDAFATAEEIILADDVLVTEKLTLAAGKNVTIDLNGNTLSGAFNVAGSDALISNSGNLTIKNGTVIYLSEAPDLEWTLGFPSYATNTISNRGNLVIEEGATIINETVGGASYAVDNYAGATLTVNGGIVKAENIAIRMFSNSATQANTVTINDGYIQGKRAVWVQLPSSNSAVAPLTNLTVNGGTLRSNVMDGSGQVIYSYSYGNSFAATNITIAGGSFENGSVQFGGGYKGDVENVSITGGTFEQDVIRWTTNDTYAVVRAAG